MAQNPEVYVYIGLGVMAAMAIGISMVRGHLEKKRKSE